MIQMVYDEVKINTPQELQRFTMGGGYVTS